jgi:hypothetical protein
VEREARNKAEGKAVRLAVLVGQAMVALEGWCSAAVGVAPAEDKSEEKVGPFMRAL